MNSTKPSVSRVRFGMDRSAGISFLSQLLATQRQAYRMQLGLAGSLVLLGVTLILAGSLLTGVLLADYWKWLLTLGGTFVASLSSLRVNDVYGAKARLEALARLRADYERASGPLTVVPPDEAVRLRERVEKLFDKTLGL